MTLYKALNLPSGKITGFAIVVRDPKILQIERKEDFRFDGIQSPSPMRLP